MAKLQNISGLLVAINSDYTKDAAVTTKTTRAELTKMLQATEIALVEVLPRMEGYASKVEDLTKDKQDLLNRVGKLNREVIELKGACESHEEQKDFLYQEVDELKESNSKLEEQKEELEAKINNLAADLKIEAARNKDAEHKAETLQATIDKLTKRSLFERLFNKV